MKVVDLVINYNDLRVRLRLQLIVVFEKNMSTDLKEMRQAQQQSQRWPDKQYKGGHRKGEKAEYWE